MADVAQLVERRVVVPNVVGSSPIVRPMNILRDLSYSLLHRLELRSLFCYDDCMPELSIECAQPYNNDWDNDAAVQALSSLLSRARKQEQQTSLVLLVDDRSYEDSAFDFDHYSTWLR